VRDQVHLVGDVMADVALSFLPVAHERSTALADTGVEAGGYALMTVHRAGNVDVPERLERVVQIAEQLPLPAVFPVHPRTHARLRDAGLLERLQAAVKTTQPLGYLDFLVLASHAKAVLTDSGGVQKEAYLLGTPCVTLRNTTEWVETVNLGWNVLVDLDPGAAIGALMRPLPSGERPELYGGGHAADRISDVLASYTPTR
jgi:UDP-N-acetylglucosamine 2-epimerase (non-hydrolysing)/UDP-GlcNAc3NAcA epimerase